MERDMKDSPYFVTQGYQDNAKVWRIYDRRDGAGARWICTCPRPDDAYKIVDALNALMLQRV
jgi:hypothetical protein